VTTVRAALEAPPKLRPTYLGSDVGALLVAHPEPGLDDGGAVCGEWQAAVTDNDGGAALVLKQVPGHSPGSGSAEDRAGDLDAWRALCAAAWAAFPETAADGIHVRPDGEGDPTAAEQVLDRLDLA
jgi:hypothetical protein